MKNINEPKSFGTHVELEEFYEYNRICIEKLTNVYDTIQYTISQFEFYIKNDCTLRREITEARIRIKELIAQRSMILALINHMDSSYISLFIERQKTDLRDQLEKLEFERAKILEQLA